MSETPGAVKEGKAWDINVDYENDERQMFSHKSSSATIHHAPMG